MIVAECFFGVLIKVLAVKKRHHVFNWWFIADSHKRKPRRGPLLAKSDGGLFSEPNIGSHLINRQRLWPFLTLTFGRCSANDTTRTKMEPSKITSFGQYLPEIRPFTSRAFAPHCGP